jgi:hypothetical protein
LAAACGTSRRWTRAGTSSTAATSTRTTSSRCWRRARRCTTDPTSNRGRSTTRASRCIQVSAERIYIVSNVVVHTTKGGRTSVTAASEAKAATAPGITEATVEAVVTETTVETIIPAETTIETIVPAIVNETTIETIVPAKTTATVKAAAPWITKTSAETGIVNQDSSTTLAEGRVVVTSVNVVRIIVAETTEWATETTDTAAVLVVVRIIIVVIVVFSISGIIVAIVSVAIGRRILRRIKIARIVIDVIVLSKSRRCDEQQSQEAEGCGEYVITHDVRVLM